MDWPLAGCDYVYFIVYKHLLIIKFLKLLVKILTVGVLDICASYG